MKKLLIRCGIILFLVFAIFAMLALAPVQEADLGDEEQIQKDVVRFHVIAKSDQPLDQRLKLEVRDAVLDYLRPGLQGVQDQKEAAEIIRRELPQIEEVAVRTLRSQGCGDPVKAYYGVFDFPVRVYGPLSFPEGKYQALRVVLGEGEGKNWWCCLFPPLCYVDLAASAKQLEDKKETVAADPQMADEEAPPQEESDKDDPQKNKDERTEEEPSPKKPLQEDNSLGEEKPLQEQTNKVLLIDSYSEPEKELRLTTKIGEWLKDSHDRSLLSWFWERRS